MVGSEVYSAEIKKTEVLMENFRRAIGKILMIILQLHAYLSKNHLVTRGFHVKSFVLNHLGLRIKETKEVYEGEVTELTPCETENPLGGNFFRAFIASFAGKRRTGLHMPKCLRDACGGGGYNVELSFLVTLANHFYQFPAA